MPFVLQLVSAGGVHAVAVNDFQARMYTDASGQMPYRLFVPPNYNPEGKYPLVVFLHGIGEAGTNNSLQLSKHTSAMVFAEERNQVNHPCFVLAPQHPVGVLWATENIITRMKDLVAAVSSEFSGVDRDRVYITGLSNGGYASWYAPTKFPGVFAAAAPIASAPYGLSAQSLLHFPIWASNNSGDSYTADLDGFVSELKTIGGEIRYSRYVGGGHNAWNTAYSEPELIPWLFQFKRDSTLPSTPAGLTANAISAKLVRLNWTASVDNESTILEYRIYRDGTKIASVYGDSYGKTAATTYTDETVSENSSYDYHIVAVNGGNLPSVPSVQISVVTPADLTPPAILGVHGGETEILIRFDDRLNKASAETVANYSLEGGVAISSATLEPDQKTVKLATGKLEVGKSYQLVVRNVRNSAATSSAIPAGGIAFRFVNIPFANLQLWLHADAGITEGDNGGVKEWKDQSPVGNHGIQRVEHYRPRVSQLGGAKALSFDGVDDYIALPDGFANLSGGVTVFVVARPTNNTSFGRLFDFGNGTDADGKIQGNDAVSLGRISTASVIRYEVFGSNDSGSSLLTNGLQRDVTDIVTLVQMGGTPGAQSAVSMYRGFGLHRSGLVQVPRNIERKQNYIGRWNIKNPLTTGGNFEGQISEVLFYNRPLSIGERLGIQQYLHDKYIADGVTNHAPVVEVEPVPNLQVVSTSPTVSTSLNGVAVDDALPKNSSLQIAWSQVSGPGTVMFTDPSKLNTTASFNTPGDYVLRLTASDGQLSGNADVPVKVLYADVSPPVIESVIAKGLSNEIWLRFSEPVDAASATNVSNYQVTFGVSVLDARLLDDQRTVVLTVSYLKDERNYTVSTSGIKDLASPPNSGSSEGTATYSTTFTFQQFETGDLSGWSIVDEGISDPVSQWSVVNGWMRESSNLNDNRDAANDRVGTFAYWNESGSANWRDYRFQGRLRSTDDDGIGVMFYYKDSDNYYRFEMDSQRSFRKLIQKVNGQVTLLKQENIGFVVGQSYDLQVEVGDNSILVKLDGVPLFGGPVSAGVLTGGTFALYSWGNTGAHFSDVRATFIGETLQDEDLSSLGLVPLNVGSSDLGSARLFGSGSISLSSMASGFSAAGDETYLQQRFFGGDFDVRVRVTGMANGGAGSLAGLMARESLSATSRFFALGVRPDGTVQLDARSAGGQLTTTSVATLSFPNVWLRLQRSGGTIMAWSSPDGSAWTKHGEVEANPPAAPWLVGMFLHSGQAGQQVEARFENVDSLAIPPSLSKGRYFYKQDYVDTALPDFAATKDSIPAPILDGNPEWVTLYWKTWELAYQHYRKPSSGSQLVSNYMDEAFDANTLFQWDTTFMTMFGQYNNRNFPAIESLDNFYHAQRSNGFIARSFDETSGTSSVEGPDSVNPPLFAWAEWENFQVTGDLARLSQVVLPLEKYGEWLESNRAKAGTAHGLFYNTPLGSGMDNTPRTGSGWIDMSAQMVLHYHYLAKILEAIGQQSKAADYRQMADALAGKINLWMWDDIDGQYYDVYDDGSFAIRRTIASFWPLLAGVSDRARAVELVGHLRDPATFNRLVPFPSLAADDPLYHVLGDYWRGGVWAPTTYAVIKGLEEIEFPKMASESSARYLEALSGVYQATGTLWENYAPDSHARGNRSFDDFVGWTGLGPISLLMENIIGLRPNAPRNTVTWDIRRTDRHGVEHYPLGSNDISLVASARASTSAAVSISVENSEPFDLRLKAAGREITFHLAAGRHTLSTDDGLLLPPSGLQATRTGATSGSLSWTDENAAETGYRIYRRAASDPDWDETAWQVAGEVPANTTGFVDALPQIQDSAYRYVVRAFNADELSSASAEVNITTLAPIPSLDVSPGGTVDIHESITFDASDSVDPGGSIESWEWDFGDGHVLTNGSIVVHAFDLPGRYRVRLTVTSSSGLKRKISHVVKVQDKSNLKDAMLVVGSTTLNPAERELKHQLERRGYFVEVATGAAASTASASGMDLILISSSVASTDVNTKFRDVPVPVLVYESLLFDDMGMTGMATSEYGNQGNQTKVSILNASHPLAGGLSEGSLTVYIQSAFVSWGRPNEHAISIASVEGDASRKVIFGYEEGSQMVGMIAPERRLGFFFENDGAGLLTEEGSALLDAALEWLVNKKPTVRITAPLTGEDFVSDDQIVFSAEATDADGTISRVEFFNGAESLGFSSTPPYRTTATGFLPGTHSITAIATDNRGGSRVSKPVSIHVVPGSALDLWRQKHFLAEELANPDLSGNRADPDGDQINNLLEFAFDLDPRRWDAAGQALGQMEVDGEIYMTITYTRPKNAAGLDYKVGVSDDLKTWYSGPTATVETNRVDHGKTWTITVRDLVPITSVNRRFIRLSIESAPDEVSYREDFDSLPASPSGFDSVWSSNLTLPLWYANRNQIRVTNGSGGSLDSAGFARLTSFGMDNSSERALGATHHLFAGDATVFGIRFINDTGRTLTHFSIAFDGEQWRRASVATASDQTLTCEYAINPTGLTSGGYIPLPGITFHSIDDGGGGAGGAGLNGNAVALRKMSAAVTGIEWQPGESLWIRWVDIDDLGANDHGLGIDNFEFRTGADGQTAISDSSGMLTFPQP